MMRFECIERLMTLFDIENQITKSCKAVGMRAILCERRKYEYCNYRYFKERK